MTIDKDTQSTFGFAFSRSMYYAKTMEGMINASSKYHKALINETYRGIYKNDSLYSYIYRLNSIYDDLVQKIGNLEDYNNSVASIIESLNERLTKYGSLATVEDYIQLSDIFSLSIDQYYDRTLDKNKNIFTEITNINQAVLDDVLYKYNDDVYFKHNGELELLGSHSKDYNKILNKYYQARNLYKIYNDINDQLSKKQEFEKINGINLTGYLIDHESQSYKLLKDNNETISKMIETSDRILKGEDQHVGNATINGFVVDYNNIKIDLSNNIFLGTQLIDFKINNNSVVELKTKNLENDIENTNRIISSNIQTKYNSAAFTVNALSDINNFNNATFKLFNTVDYPTTPNTEYSFNLELPVINGSSEIINTTYNGQVDSLPYKFEYDHHKNIGNLYEEYSDYVNNNENFYDIFYEKTRSYYRYYRNDSEFLEFYFDIPNVYKLIKVENYKYKYNPNNNKTNLEISFITNTNDPIKQSIELDTNFNFDKAVYIEKIENNQLYLSNNSTIELSVETYQDEIRLEKLDQKDSGIPGIDIYKFKFGNIIDGYKECELLLGNGDENELDELPGARLINAYSDEHVTYEGIHTIHEINNYFQTDSSNNPIVVSLLNRWINHKRLSFKQELIPNEDNSSYTEKISLGNYELHRSIDANFNDLLITSNISNKDNIIEVNHSINLKNGTEPLRIDQTINKTSKELTRIYYSKTDYVTKVVFLYNFDLAEFNRILSNYFYLPESNLNDEDKEIILEFKKKFQEQLDFIEYTFDTINFDLIYYLYENEGLTELHEQVLNDNNVDFKYFRSGYSLIKNNYNVIYNSETPVLSDNVDDDLKEETIEFKKAIGFFNESNDEAIAYHNIYLTDNDFDESLITKFNDNITEYLKSSYILPSTDATKSNSLMINPDANNEELMFKNDDGDVDENKGYNVIGESLSIKRYRGTDVSVLNENAIVTLSEMTTINIVNGIKSQLIFSKDDYYDNGTYKTIILSLNNQSDNMVRILISLQNVTDNLDTNDTKVKIPMLFYLLDSKQILDIKLKLESNDKDAKCTIMSLDY